MAAVTWTGLDELHTWLRTLPEHLTAEATGIVSGAADGTLAEVAAGYLGHAHSGNLERGLKKVEKALGRYGVGYQVRNTAPHAFWFEHGTQVRHTALGVNRGAMPPAHVFVPPAERHRARMYAQLRDMMIREGFTVRG